MNCAGKEERQDATQHGVRSTVLGGENAVPTQTIEVVDGRWRPLCRRTTRLDWYYEENEQTRDRGQGTGIPGTWTGDVEPGSSPVHLCPFLGWHRRRPMQVPLPFGRFGSWIAAGVESATYAGRISCWRHDEGDVVAWRSQRAPFFNKLG